MSFQRHKMHGLTYFEWQLQVLRKNITIVDQLKCWLSLISTETLDNTSGWRNCQLEKDGIRVLVRKKQDFIDGTCKECLVIAAVKIPGPLQNKGWFKSFLSLCCAVNPWDAIVIEDVENEYLRRFCVRLDFRVFDPFFKTTYLVNEARFQELNIPILGSTV